MTSIHDRRPFVIRPVSRTGWKQGLGTDRRATHKTATANYLYIKRLDGCDLIGSLPKFSQRNDLVDADLAVPYSAPDWAVEPGLIWREIDTALKDKAEDAVSARHIVMTLPKGGAAQEWRRLIERFSEEHFTRKGMICDWAIHAKAQQGSGWLTRPHAHLLITARGWKHDRRHGLQHPVWCRGDSARRHLEEAWLTLSGLSVGPYAWKEW
jgi:hypothetical protein